jgi:hypothetical protein
VSAWGGVQTPNSTCFCWACVAKMEYSTEAGSGVGVVDVAPPRHVEAALCGSPAVALRPSLGPRVPTVAISCAQLLCAVLVFMRVCTLVCFEVWLDDCCCGQVHIDVARRMDVAAGVAALINVLLQRVVRVD